MPGCVLACGPLESQLHVKGEKGHKRTRSKCRVSDHENSEFTHGFAPYPGPGTQFNTIQALSGSLLRGWDAARCSGGLDAAMRWPLTSRNWQETC